MALAKVTFTIDQATIALLEDASARLSLPKSRIVREAVLEFHDRIGRLSPRERTEMLRAFDELVPKIPPRPQAAVDRELAEIRAARRTGGRRSSEGRK